MNAKATEGGDRNVTGHDESSTVSSEITTADKKEEASDQVLIMMHLRTMLLIVMNH